MELQHASSSNMVEILTKVLLFMVGTAAVLGILSFNRQPGGVFFTRCSSIGSICSYDAWC
jgi:hypothetical protein